MRGRTRTGRVSRGAVGRLVGSGAGGVWFGVGVSGAGLVVASLRRGRGVARGGGSGRRGGRRGGRLGGRRGRRNGSVVRWWRGRSARPTIGRRGSAWWVRPDRFRDLGWSRSLLLLGGCVS